MKKFFAVVLTMVLAISTVFPSVLHAQTTKQVHPKNNKIMLDKETLNTVDKYITIENDEFEIEQEEKLKKELSEREFKLVKMKMNHVNEKMEKVKDLVKVNKDMIQYVIIDRELKAKVEQTGYNYDLNAKLDNSKMNSSFASLKARGIQLYSTNGINKVDWHWWGAEIWLSKNTVTNIINAGVAGGTVILGSLIPGFGHALLIAANGLIISWFVGENTRAIKFNINWVGNISDFQYQ